MKLPRPRLHLRTLLLLMALVAVGMFVVRMKQRQSALRVAADEYGARQARSLEQAAWMERQAAGLAHQRTAGTEPEALRSVLPEDYAKSADFYRRQAAYYARLRRELQSRWW